MKQTKILFILLICINGLVFPSFGKNPELKIEKEMRIPCRAFSSSIKSYAGILEQQPIWSIGMKKKMVESILEKTREEKLPKGLSNYKERDANETNFPYFTLYAIATYKLPNGRTVYFVEFPADENADLPEGLRPTETIYFSMAEVSLDLKRGYNKAIDGSPFKCFNSAELYPGKKIPCRITDAGAIEANYVWKNSDWQEYLIADAQLVTQEGLNTAVWPSVIRTSDGRKKYKDFFPLYYANVVSQFTDSGKKYYIVEVIKNFNKRLPQTLLPVYDVFYMVISENGVDISRGYRDSKAVLPENMPSLPK